MVSAGHLAKFAMVALMNGMPERELSQALNVGADRRDIVSRLFTSPALDRVVGYVVDVPDGKFAQDDPRPRHASA
jgi:hypothetical protein